MAFQLKQPIVPSLFTILLLLSIMPSSHAKAKPCKCPDSDHDGWRNYTFDDPGFLFQLIDKDSKSVRTVDPLDLNFFRNLSDAELKNSAALSTIDTMIPLWQDPFGGYLEEASFSVNIVYQPVWSDESQNQSSTPAVYSGLAFLILPIFEAEMFKEEVVSYTLAKTLVASVGSLKLHGRTSRNAPVSGSSVSVTTGYTRSRDDNLTVGGNIMRVDITIDTTHTAAAFYSVWIDYDSVGRRLSVYVEVEGNPKPNNPIAEVHLNVSSVAESYVAFGLLSTAAQLLASGGINWSAAVEALPYTPYGPYGPTGYLHRGLSRQVTILSSVLGSVAATALMATAVACYLNSRYRRWHGDLDQLARTMERLPGVPTKVEFADIKKATRNFHEDMKLGGGGFGTVYRCTLSAVMSKTERPIDVAVKRFTRDVQNQRYDDFLAEVSIINRLRHKNIVPLVGWSYNKGEPLLVFEFMTNGSLDQHLFPKNHNGNSRRNGTGIKWATRYEIVRDIATGLHYVHHEYEPMVLHRDIKASNVMLDSMFRARLGDFGLACTVAVDRNSATGGGGTWGYIAPEYAMCGRATRQTDVFALGVLILEVITGQRALIHEAVDDDDVHITDRVWRVRRGGRLLECVHAVMLDASYDDEEQLVLGVRNDVERLLLLGLACSNPNPLDRPTMPEVVQIIAKSAPPLEVPLLKPRFVWPASEGVVLHNDDSVGTSMTSNLHTSMASTAEKGSQSKVSLGQLMAVSQTRAAGGHPRFNWSTLFLSQPPVLSAPTANLIIQTVLAKLFPFIKLASTDLRMVVST